MTSQPWRLPAAAARQMCEANAGRARGGLPRDLDDRLRWYAGLALGVPRRVIGVLGLQCSDEIRKRRLVVRRTMRQVGPPIDPTTDELAVEQILVEHDLRHGEQDRCFGPGPCRQPIVGPGGGVREAWIDHRDLCATLLGLDDPLGVRIEVMAGLKVR